MSTDRDEQFYAWVYLGRGGRYFSVENGNLLPGKLTDFFSILSSTRISLGYALVLCLFIVLYQKETVDATLCNQFCSRYRFADSIDVRRDFFCSTCNIFSFKNQFDGNLKNISIVYSPSSNGSKIFRVVKLAARQSQQENIQLLRY